MKFTGERYIPGETRKIIEEDHLQRYHFAKNFSNHKIVLDIACGTGYGSQIIKSGGANHVIGVDISSEAIDYAKNKFNNDHIEFVCRPADDLPFNKAYFDLVVSFETIEHLDDKTRNNYLKELYRTMKEGAQLIISTPNKLVTSPRRDKPRNKYHFREYKLNELKDILTKNNFQIKSIYGQRQIKKIFSYFLVRKFIYLLGWFNKIHFKIYDEASGPEVLPIKNGYEPTYFIVIAKK
ncbi:MAG: methyltransferase domain-containing protein [Candidatus Buchananbacteria bacterium]|nr:methyltransferase domain-containing protein [Candidatus Buchananbacteria bacterium]